MSDTDIGSGVRLEETPPTMPQSMDDARRELDAAVLQAKKHCLEYGTQQESGQEAHIKRYLYAVTVMRNDRFFSLHSGRRSRSLTRVYVEQREDRERSAHPSLPKKTDFAEEEVEDRTIRLEWHETIEGRRADVVEEDRKAIDELQKSLPVEYHQWEHDIQLQSEENATTWRVGDHLFSYEEPFDLSVELPEKVHYFFTGERLPERRRRYNSLPNLSTVGLDSLLSQDHSHHSLYGHGFRHIGNTFMSRTMDGLDENRLQMGARPSLHEGIYSTIPIVVYERGSRQSLHNIHAQSHTSHEEHYAVSEVEHRVEQTPSTSLVDHYAEPEITSAVEHVNESTIVEPPSPEHQHSAESFTTKFAADLIHVGEVIKEAVTHQTHHEEPIYDHVYEERIYDHVAHDRHDAAPPIPTSPMPTDTLHYAAVAVATGDDDAHLYKDDENIYEEIDSHIIDSTGYAEPHVYDVPSETKVEKEHEYAEVAREEHTHRAAESVEQFSSLRNKFESQEGTENYYEKATAPRRKDYDYDENGNHDEVLERTPEFSESSSPHVVLRNVKPYVGSPTFNKLQKKFFPEDLAQRQAQRDREDVVDPAVLHSPTTIHINDGQIETEYRAYDKNHYDDSTATLVMATPLDEVAARRTMTIRRMSRNNRWSEDEPESPRIRTHNLDEIIPPNSPFVRVPSPLASPRSPSISPVPPRSQISPAPRATSISPVSPVSPRPTENNNDAKFTRPEELNFRTKHDVPKAPITPVERVVSSEATTPRSPVELYEFGSVKERRKMFENGSAPPLPGYTSTRTIGTGARPYTRAPATVRLETIRDSPIQVAAKSPEPVSSPVEVKLRKTIKEDVPVPQKQEVDPNRRKSVLEMRREYEASLGSQPSTTTNSPQRSRTNSRRRTGEVQIGAGVALDTQGKNTDEQSSVARRTVHRTVDIPMHQEASPSSVAIGQGATVSRSEDYRRHETSAYSTTVTIGRGVEIRQSPSPVPAARVSAGAVPTSAPPIEPSLPEGTSLTVDFDLVTAKPAQVEDVRESTAVVEEEPTPLQRNGSGRRSWTVKTYENNIRFDNQKLKMPDVDYATANGHIPNGIEKMNGEENTVLKEWDPRPLVRNLYEVSYEPRVETKRNRFFTMEGHVEVPSQETNTLAELEREWKSQYMRTKEGRLQIFASHCSTDAPAEEIILSGCDVDANRDERTLTIHGGKDKIRMLLRVPSNVFDKWRQALLSHAASSQIDAYVKPVHRTMDHLSERVVIIEIGSCSIRGGRLTQEPSLPQSFFPAIGVRTEDGRIIVGEDAYTPQVRHQGEFVRPIQASDPAVERYTMDKEVVKACMNKVVTDLQIDPRKYKVLLSIPQNIPIVLISELVTIALQEIKFQGAAITRQPSLILYAYDVTTGVVVDIGDRLNIVPVIDGYVVDSAICSIPYGATQVREALRSDLCAHNKGLYSFQSPIEKLILRYVMEQVCYVPEDYANESGTKDVHVSLDEFNPTPGMPTKFNIDSSRFTCTEGLFRPKKWGLDTKGLHQLVHEAVQMSPIDARRILYRNIYLAGGASLLPGLAEKLEQELANIVPNTIHTQVHISPWRYNAAFLGAQVVASSSTFEDQCVTAENLQKFLFDLSTSTF